MDYTQKYTCSCFAMEKTTSITVIISQVKQTYNQVQYQYNTIPYNTIQCKNAKGYRQDNCENKRINMVIMGWFLVCYPKSVPAYLVHFTNKCTDGWRRKERELFPKYFRFCRNSFFWKYTRILFWVSSSILVGGTLDLIHHNHQHHQKIKCQLSTKDLSFYIFPN